MCNHYISERSLIRVIGYKGKYFGYRLSHEHLFSILVDSLDSRVMSV